MWFIFNIVRAVYVVTNFNTGDGEVIFEDDTDDDSDMFDDEGNIVIVYCYHVKHKLNSWH